MGLCCWERFCNIFIFSSIPPCLNFSRHLAKLTFICWHLRSEPNSLKSIGAFSLTSVTFTSAFKKRQTEQAWKEVLTKLPSLVQAMAIVVSLLKGSVTQNSLERTMGKKNSLLLLWKMLWPSDRCLINKIKCINSRQIQEEGIPHPINLIVIELFFFFPTLDNPVWESSELIK